MRGESRAIWRRWEIDLVVRFRCCIVVVGGGVNWDDEEVVLVHLALSIEFERKRSGGETMGSLTCRVIGYYRHN